MTIVPEFRPIQDVNGGAWHAARRLPCGGWASEVECPSRTAAEAECARLRREAEREAGRERESRALLDRRAGL